MIDGEYTGLLRRRKIFHHRVVSIHMPHGCSKEIDSFKAAQTVSAPSHTVRLPALVFSQDGPSYS